jgi:hypothetical protein
LSQGQLPAGSSSLWNVIVGLRYPRLTY